MIALAVAGAIGLTLKQPWLFPSLGPTLMVMAETPRQPAAHPRNVLIGHATGVGAGLLALLVTGLTTHPPVIEEGVTAARILAACLSVGLTALVLQALRCPHPPAGATTLVVSLGILTSGSEVATLLLAVLVCTVVAAALERLVALRRS